MSSPYQTFLSAPNLSTLIYPTLFSVAMIIMMSYLTGPAPCSYPEDEIPPSTSSGTPARKKTLSIVSHDRHAALSPAPDLLYDLRGVPSPPLEDRERYTGHSSVIRDVLLQEPQYCALLEAAEKEIRGAMRTIARREAEGKDVGEDEGKDVGKDEREGEGDGEGEGDITLRVGCLCGSGHHRSVAFSEQLAMVEWPRDWQLELTHRDLTPEVQRRKAWERRKG
ncbi:hypothetical protein GGR53DRAFT_468302 [Hypoxylon sp. FL1150]|nr:hypothetical protein GGR53DRAFT_468302 [Hypoxylon sp. FL1150]